MRWIKILTSFWPLLVVSLPASWYVEIIRHTPLLVQIVWVFYFLPILVRLDLTAFLSFVATISVHFFAYMAEIIRAGIASNYKGPTDAVRWSIPRRFS